jgi:hypothetical protein
VSVTHGAGMQCEVICISIAAPQLVQSTQHAWVTKGYFCDVCELALPKQNSWQCPPACPVLAVAVVFLDPAGITEVAFHLSGS